MMDANAYLKIVRASAVYDLIVTLPFATPWTFAAVAGFISGLDTSLSLPGAMPPPDMLHTLFANLMGSVVVVWSVVRLRLGLAVLGRYDAVARLLFACWLINALANGLSWVVLPLLVIEIAFGIAQSLPARRPATVAAMPE